MNNLYSVKSPNHAFDPASELLDPKAVTLSEKEYLGYRRSFRESADCPIMGTTSISGGAAGSCKMT